MRRIALFSDVHGNVPALDAVLDDIAVAQVGEVYCLGDLVGYGPDPGGVIERIRRDGIATIQGNYDRGVGNRSGDCGCHYATEQARDDGAASYAFTAGVLTDTDLDWLAALPEQLRLEHEGVRVLLTHGSPRRINEYLLPDREDRQLVRLAEEAGADVVCVGHVHIPYHRSMAARDGCQVHYVSAGSVGKPKDGDPRAGWVEAVIGSADEVRRAAAADGSAAAVGVGSAVWLGAIVHRVEYDIESVAGAMGAAGLPQTLAEALRRG